MRSRGLPGGSPPLGTTSSTGYSSLIGLRTLAVSEVKIDRAFVTELDRREADRSIVRSIIALAHGLGCTVTAEGVQTPETAGWLKGASCDSAQGYHFARPAPWPELLERFGGPNATATIATTTNT
jgi:EAL domain-containing protein (putative c-di-GMP-specific phosphodiesterase class I)